MGTRLRLVDFLGFTPLVHRPPLPRRWWVYCAVAYLAPSLVLQFVASEEVPYRDLVWLVTLMVQVGRRGLIQANKRRLMCLSLFWHFLDVVWIGVFTFVYLMGMLR